MGERPRETGEHGSVGWLEGRVGHLVLRWQRALARRGVNTTAFGWLRQHRPRFVAGARQSRGPPRSGTRKAMGPLTRPRPFINDVWATRGSRKIGRDYSST